MGYAPLVELEKAVDTHANTDIYNRSGNMITVD